MPCLQGSFQKARAHKALSVTHGLLSVSSESRRHKREPGDTHAGIKDEHVKDANNR